MKNTDNYWIYMNLQKVRQFPKNRNEDEPHEYKKEIQVDRKTREFHNKYDYVK